MWASRRLTLWWGGGALVTGALVGALVWWGVFRQPTPAVDTKAPVQTTEPQQTGRVGEGVAVQSPVIRQTDGGRTAWQVRFKELKVQAGSDAVAAAGLQEALIYDKTGLPAIRLTADKAKGNTATEELEVTGNVRATSHKGALITTDQVRWLEKERRLHCPGLVTVRTRNAAMTTRGLSYYVDSDTVKAPGLVRVYSGRNKLLGRQLVYNVETEALEMRQVQAIFNPREVAPVASPQR